MKRLQFIIFFLTASIGLVAQNVEFSISAPNVVAVGEQFRIVYRLNARPQNFNPPSFNDFYILAGPSSSTSSSIQIINGQMTQTHEFSYTYILEATQEGQFTLEPATATVSKREYKSKVHTIEVVNSGKSTAGQQPASQPSQQAQAQTQKATDELYVLSLIHI